jgi:hypothetical protein
MPKIQPAVKTLFFTITAAPNLDTSSFIDLSQCASVVNRRFYRQGLNWVVAGFKVIAQPGYLGSVAILKLPDTWSVSNSWHKTFAAWKAQQDEALDDGGSQSAVARYRDFKIHMDPNHVAAGFAANLRPRDAVSAQFSQGEWESSQVVIPNTGGVVGDTDEFLLHMCGSDGAASFGMISNYSVSRAFPQSPDPVSGTVSASYFSEMFNVGMDDVEILANATNKNDDLPYDQDNYPGGGVNASGLQVVDVTAVTARSLMDTTSMKGDTFPCGLINVKVNSEAESAPTATTVSLLCFLVPGNSRGYMTQEMQDM